MLTCGNVSMRQESPLAAEDEEEETVQWSVMGVVSCIPLINWTVGAVISS